MFIIGISGKAESGKSTFASILKKELEKRDKKVLLINYGDFVKFVAKQYYNWNGNKDESGRALLQKVGTQQGRNGVGENIWVDMVINTVKVVRNDYDVAIIADCRFPNELNRWEEKGEKIVKIRIERPNHENKLTKTQREHPSETSLDTYNKWDYTIINIYNLEMLSQRATEIINSLIKE